MIGVNKVNGVIGIIGVNGVIGVNRVIGVNGVNSGISRTVTQLVMDYFVQKAKKHWIVI